MFPSAAHANTKEDFEKLATKTDRVGAFEATLNAHTNALDTILRNSEHWKTEATALHYANQRHERWIKQLADKIGIKLEDEV